MTTALRIARAAAVYFAAIFALGFALGTVRVLWLAPRAGETAAVLAELPVMLAASWFAARWQTRRHGIKSSPAALAMGALAFALLLGAELLLGLATGQAPREWLAGLARPPGAIGLAGQAAFALFPLAVRRGGRRLAVVQSARFRRPWRRSRWTQARSYGVKPTRFKQAPKSWAQAFSETRPFLLLIALATLAAVHQSAGFYEPPGFLQSDPEEVAGVFSRCGRGRFGHCVIDGDTFKIGDEKFRVTGIDTAEVDARCPAEAAQAEASAAALQAWLNRGPFRITTRLDEPTDRYGRTLAIVKRSEPGGSEDRLADWMTAHGGARGYDGGFRGGWC